MKERGIPVAWLERALAEPERTERDPSDPELVHHLKVISEHGGRVLRVVVTKEFPHRIVTLSSDRAMKGRL